MSVQEQKGIRDFLYFDVDKASSIISQLEGGLITEIGEQMEEGKDQRNIRKYDLKLFKPEFGGIETEKSLLRENKILHHAIFTRMEELLFEKDLAVNMNGMITADDLGPERVHKLLEDKYYILSEGWAYLEDFQRIKHIADRFNPLVEFIAKCNMSQFESSEEYQQLKAQIEDKKYKISKLNGKQRINEEAKMAKLESELNGVVKRLTHADGVPDWLLQGTKDFIDTFIANRINLRIYPFENLPELHVIANLKRNCFVDADLENLISAYGTRPNIKLTVFGLITSLPRKEGETFDPMTQYDYYGSNAPEEVGFEKAFRGIFTAMEGFEKFVRFSRFPNVTVYPIAVFRDIKVPSSE